jgi:geranylgeranyl diphosphate synthase type II
MVDLQTYLSTHKQTVDGALERLLPPPEGPAKTVAEAMRYAVMAGGKRLRPVLAIASCEACGGRPESVLEPAAALELIHTYSLIHDDLPAMDDDDLRRGRPTAHRAFGEAEAILAGDALLTLAFEILASYPQGPQFAARRTEAVVLAARGAGVDGMVGGQVADLEGQDGQSDEQGLRWIHQHKTGALIAASAELGALHAGAGPDARAALARFGLTVGLAFQVADDILDCTSTAEELGKTPGKDQRDGKATYPALFGLDAARARAEQLVGEAIQTLEPLGLLSEPLRDLAELTVRRTR